MSCNSCSGDQTRNTVIYACSGAADVGDIADRCARRLAREGAGKMSCATGVGAGVQSLRNTALSASRILAVDGCATRCVERALNETGAKDFIHIELGSEGFPKGQSPATDENIERALGILRERLAAV